VITHDDLRAAGFTRHRAGRPYAIALWELRVEDPSRLEAPRSYSIHLYEYNPPDFYPGLPAASVDEHRWEAEAFLYLPGPQIPTMRVCYFVRSTTTLAEVCDFYARAFVALGCIPDPYNQPG